MSATVLVLALDSFDANLMNEMIDDGLMPFCESLLNKGEIGQLNTPLPLNLTSYWTTIATGKLSDEHGLCSEVSVCPDGLTSRVSSSDDLNQPTIWQTAMDNNLIAKVIGWPGTYPAKTNGLQSDKCAIVSAGFEHVFSASDGCWPMFPDAVAPQTESEFVKESRLHPSELTQQQIAPFFSEQLIKQCPSLVKKAIQVMAQTSSIHNVATAWLEESRSDLVCVRFKFLGELFNAVKKLNLNCREILEPWYKYADLLIGRYMHLMDDTQNLILLSNTGIPTKTNAHTDSFTHSNATGFAAFCGPHFKQDHLLANVNGLDIYTKILSLLSIPVPAKHKQTQILPTTHFLTSISQDANSISWLEEHGIKAPDFSPAIKIVEKAQALNIMGWAQSQYARGNLTTAIDHLKQLLSRQPQNVQAILLLAQICMENDQPDECIEHLNGLSTLTQMSDWRNVIGSYKAFAKNDFEKAEEYLNKLIDDKTKLIDAKFWLGKLMVKQSKYHQAIAILETLCNAQSLMPKYLFELGSAYHHINELTKASDTLSQAINLEPMNGRFFIARARIFISLKKFEEARYDLSRAILINPNDEQATRLISSALA